MGQNRVGTNSCKVALLSTIALIISDSTHNFKTEGKRSLQAFGEYNEISSHSCTQVIFLSPHKSLVTNECHSPHFYTNFTSAINSNITEDSVHIASYSSTFLQLKSHNNSQKLKINYRLFTLRYRQYACLRHDRVSSIRHDNYSIPVQKQDLLILNWYSTSQTNRRKPRLWPRKRM